MRTWASARAKPDGRASVAQVEPASQARGVGRALLARSEELARGWGASRMRMTVISVRAELIAYYERRGCVAARLASRVACTAGVCAVSSACCALTPVTRTCVCVCVCVCVYVLVCAFVCVLSLRAVRVARCIRASLAAFAPRCEICLASAFIQYRHHAAVTARVTSSVFMCACLLFVVCCRWRQRARRYTATGAREPFPAGAGVGVPLLELWLDEYVKPLT